ncbi:MAG TPA: hypothetical protein VFQ30_10895, partial [Ktedonobacteraceae bacterium]|nr:hypothetical protein [Ktedonobacteraceae bacterium]
ACSNETTYTIVPPASTPAKQVTVVQPTPLTPTPTPVAQQQLPQGLLKSDYPVLDWVFSVDCGQGANSLNSGPMNGALAYDSAAWLYPSDGHLVTGGQRCDQTALVQQAKQQGVAALMTVGIDSSWSALAAAQYIDRAASQPQVPCTPQASTDICAIVNWAVAGGYTGVIIDYEIVKGDYPDIARKFADYMRELQIALHQKGLLCGIALIHRIGDSQRTDPSYYGNSFEDWRQLSELDFLVVMVVDQDLSQGKPGPLVSTPWVDAQLDYIWHTVPQILSKIIFEFPLYGREWVRDAQGHWQHVGDQTCPQISASKASYTLLSGTSTDPGTPEYAWNDASGQRHEVWYDTNASLIAIMTQLQSQARSLLNNPRYRLPTSFWYRGAECPGFFGPGNALETFYKQ